MEAATSSTPPDRYAVLGNPVAHSRSPFIHHLFAQQTGQHLVYERLLCAMDGFAPAVRQFAAAGGRGCNVTIPFKFEVPALATRCTERAALAGAANVLHMSGDDWLADNTDGVGLVRDIEQGAGVDLAGQTVLLVGAGGAGAGVLGPLLQRRPAVLRVANRSVDKAQALVARHASWAAQHGVQLSACGLADAAAQGASSVVINASASSLQGAASPVPARVLGPRCLAVDLMYGSAAAPWLAWAQAHGVQARDGLGMLVEQAAEAFALWRGVMPSTAPVLAALRTELAAGR
jgi:shikimate dehydrogenase